MKRSDKFVLQDVGDASLLVPIRARARDVNGLVVLNSTARFIWELLTENRSLDELVAAVGETFAVEGEVAKVDTQAFISSIASMGMIEE